MIDKNKINHLQLREVFNKNNNELLSAISASRVVVIFILWLVALKLLFDLQCLWILKGEHGNEIVEYIIRNSTDGQHFSQ